MQQFRLPAQRGAAPLAYYVGGTDGPPLVLANGLGGPVSAFRHQLEHFGRRFRTVTWDYRGLYGSHSPARIERVDMATQADDLARVLDAAKVDQAVFVGWSMGVQVMLELAAREPERVTRLVLMSGTYRRAFAGVRLPAAERLLLPLVDEALENKDFVARVVGFVARSEGAANWIRRLRIVHPRLETRELLSLASEFQRIDFGVYFRTLKALHEHDGSHALSRVTAPTLVVAGSRDFLMPPAVARDLAERLARAELYVVPHGTHYAPAEFPDLVNARIERFLRENDAAPLLTELGSGARLSAP